MDLVSMLKFEAALQRKTLCGIGIILSSQSIYEVETQRQPNHESSNLLDSADDVILTQMKDKESG
jgi:hypothetical protein